MPSDERTPLLEDHSRNFWSFGEENRREDYHTQFCRLVGIPPSDLPPDVDPPPIGPKTLYGRALRMKRNQANTHAVTAGISNTLLLMQVVLGAAVTGLGASESSHILITLFGATNTIIAGVVAYLKSRGQPMRARMYRDDLERVVDEIENSEIMWLGISKGMHGYSDINTDDEVTVRSEVARLTRLYDRAIRSNTLNNPDMYMAGGGDGGSQLGLRKGPVPTVLPVVGSPSPPGPADPSVPGSVGAPAPVVIDVDQSPASAPPKPKEEPAPPQPKEEAKDDKKPAASNEANDGKTASTTNEGDAASLAKDGGETKDPGTTGEGGGRASSSKPNDSLLDQDDHEPAQNPS